MKTFNAIYISREKYIQSLFMNGQKLLKKQNKNLFIK